MLILTEDRRIVLDRLPVEKACVVDHETQEAWVQWQDSMVRKRGTSEGYLVVNERDIAPPSLNGKDNKDSKDIENLICAIAKERRKQAEFNLEGLQKKSLAAGILQILILGGALVAVVVIIFLLISSGNLSVPDLSGGA